MQINKLNHIAFIMDGNSTWARKNGIVAMSGYQKGIKNMIDTIVLSKRLGVRYVTFYAFSTENWNRPPDWVSNFINLIKRFLKNEEWIDKLRNEKAHLKVIGDISNFDVELKEVLCSLIEESKNNDGIFVTIALGYGGRNEIVRAIEKARKLENFVDESLFATLLDTYPYPDPDLLIRTSGKKRLSNFLLWQISYTELYFTDIEWPAFSETHLKEAIDEFYIRKRTYGS